MVRIPDRVAVVGAGSMGGAIATRLASVHPRPSVIAVTTNSRASALGYPETLVRLDRETEPSANLDAARDADLIMLGVKPKYIVEVAAEIAPVLKPDAVVVSIAAGITIAQIESALPAGTAVVRTIPNTPATIGRGVTAIAPGTAAGTADVDAVRWLFEQVGVVYETTEDRIDAVTAVAGSGPAYLFYVVEEWVAAAEHRGFSPADARLLVGATVSGAAELLAASGEEAAELRRRVTSPNGTTAAALDVLMHGGLDLLFDRATNAAELRARELAAGN